MFKKTGIFTAVAVIFMTGAVYAATVDLPRTGQTICYDTAGTVIACANTGQDGDLLKGVALPSPRFVTGIGIEADCVTDNLTGLIWAKTPDSTTRVWTVAMDYPGSITLCGHTDWRLPNVNELESLINAEQSNPAAWLNTQGFSNVQAGDYWSSTTYASLIDVAWIIGMLDGNVGNGGKSSSNYVWSVRSGQ